MKGTTGSNFGLAAVIAFVGAAAQYDQPHVLIAISRAPISLASILDKDCINISSEKCYSFRYNFH